MNILEIKKLSTGYGQLQIIDDLSMTVKKSEITAIIGPNGSGKSTILKAVCGLIPIWKGDIIFNGHSIKNKSTSQNIASGLTFSPQGNRVFDELSVRENLEMAGYLLSKERLQERIESVLEIFPFLKNRLKQNAGTLSGGEQQILALTRALIPSPKLLLLDEPSLGLSPNLMTGLFQNLTTINQEMKLPILIVEQKVTKILPISNSVFSIRLGKIAFEGNPKKLMDNKKQLKDLFL